MKLICDIPGERADVFLSRSIETLSRAQAQKLIDAGAVTLRGAPLKKNYKTAPGDELEVTLPEVREVELTAQDIPLDVRYEDDDVIVICKPKGLVVHPAAGHPDGTLVNALMHHCGESLSGIGGEKRPGIVHRIDKDTSGLLIVAKNDFAHLHLSEQLQDHTLHRIYEAVVCGGVREDAGTISAPIGRHPTDRKKMTIGGVSPREAVTHFEVLERFGPYTHLKLKLETGRTHQIRVHLASRGAPILGDTVYGRKKPELGESTQCLHARELVFLHPRTGEEVRVQSELPEYFEAVLKKLRK